MISIVHLSDIHFSADVEQDALRQSTAFSDALSAVIRSSSSTLLVISGDLAFSGQSIQYDLARTFLDAVFEHLEGHHQLTAPPVVLCPGNHDCDFGSATSVREMLRSKLDPDSIDPDVYRLFTETQAEFRSFRNKLVTDGRSPAWSEVTLGLDQSRVVLNETEVAILTYNSAWNSALREQQGSLLVPTKTLEFLESAPEDSPDLVLALFHHPYAWYESSNGRRFRRALESHVDIVVTGHEHDVATYHTVSGTPSSQVEYVEGALFQGGHGTTSAFVVMEVDQEQYRTRMLAWDGTTYAEQAMSGWLPFRRNSERLRGGLSFTNEHAAFLDDPGLNLIHPAGVTLKLSDFFVYPDLQPGSGFSLDETLGRNLHPMQFVRSNTATLIVGPEESGKSALAKVLTKDLLRGGIAPLLVRAEDFRLTSETKLNKAIKRLVAQQYGDESLDTFLQLPASSTAIIIDDFHQHNLSPSRRAQFIKLLRRRFGHIVCLSHIDIRMKDYATEPSEHDPIWEFAQAEILFMGNQKRSQMVQRWYALIPPDPSKPPEAQYKEMVRVEQAITSLIDKNFLLHPYPLYVLFVLQQFRSSSQFGASAGSKGYLYESLIFRSLTSKVADGRVDSLLNWCAEFAFSLWSTDRRRASIDGLADFHRQHCDKFWVDLELRTVKEALCSANILREDESGTRFAYSYSFQYFAARGISQNMEDDVLASVVRTLCEDMHSDDSANLLMFLSYVSRQNTTIVGIMTESANRCFANRKEFNVRTGGKFLRQIETKLPVLELDNRTPMARRQARLAEMDERHTSSDGEVIPSAAVSENEHDENPVMREVMASQKHIQVLGQVLRNYSGIMPGEQKVALATTIYSLALRTLDFIINLLDDNEQDVVQDIVLALHRQDPRADLAVIQRQAIAVVFGLSIAVVVGMMNHVSASVGVKELRRVFRKLAEHENKSYQVIGLAVKLDHLDELPEIEAFELYELDGGILLVRAVVRQLLYQHMYTMPVGHRQKQKICSLMNIKLSHALLPSHPAKRK